MMSHAHVQHLCTRSSVQRPAACRPPLAERLKGLGLESPVVVALPRGGVPVGYEVATALGAPLDVGLVRKLGAPGQPEFGIGAVGEDGPWCSTRGPCVRWA